MKLSNNKVLITGATSGIGLAILEEFLQRDNDIIAVGRNASKLKELADKDQRIFPFQCDLSKSESIDDLIVFIENEHPDLNILINNAGIQYNYHFAEVHEALTKIDREIFINLNAPIKLISLLLPTISSNTNSAIINVSSGLGLVPKKDAPVYCATKAGLHMFTKSLRYQLTDTKVFEIIPPLVDTKMTEGRGRGKISPEQLAKEFIAAFKRDIFEINIGKVKLLKIINRVSPKLADRIMKG